MEDIGQLDFPIIAFASRDAFEAWLAENHTHAPGILLKIAKKGSGIDSISYASALEVALCYGWIDGLKKPFDGKYWLQRFTPRRPKSKWSQINRDKVLALIERGEMKAAGLAEIERARSDGRWDAAYEPQSRATVPEDLQRELDKNKVAGEFFATLNSVNRYAILFRLRDAKTPETRARRLAQFVAMLTEGKKLYP